MNKTIYSKQANDSILVQLKEVGGKIDSVVDSIRAELNDDNCLIDDLFAELTTLEALEQKLLSEQQPESNIFV
jgi:hypothetical protein